MRPPFSTSAAPQTLHASPWSRKAVNPDDDILREPLGARVSQTSLFRQSVYEALSGREAQVLDGMSRGLSNAAIGRCLGLAEDTVKSHARGLYAKLGAHDRAHAVATGFRIGLLR